MALDRFFVPIADAQPSDDELKCGFLWLLSRPEAERHIAVPHVAQRRAILTKIETWIPAIGRPLRKSGLVNFQDGRLTISTMHPYVQATANGACLLLWGDADQAEAVEARLGSVGAICVAPFGPTLDNWIEANGPTPVNCQALIDQSDEA